MTNLYLLSVAFLSSVAESHKVTTMDFFLNPLCTLLCGASLCFLVFFISRKYDWYYHIERFFLNRNAVKWSAIVIWVLGTIIYSIGFYIPKNEMPFDFFTGVSLLIHASLSSVEMFLSHSDLLEVREIWHHTPLYMFFFMLVHLLAVIMSLGLVFSIIANRFHSTFVLKSWVKELNKKGENKCSYTYVFWGVNSHSLSLAEQLRKCGERIVFVVDKRDEHDEESHEHRLSLSHLLGMKQADRSVIDKVKKTGGIVFKYQGVSTLENLKELVSSNTNIRLCLFSDSEKENLKNLNKIISSNVFTSKVEYFCHARKTKENIAVEHWFNKPNCKVCHLIDSSSLAVLSLIQDPTSHPVNFVDVKKDDEGSSTAIVTSRFNGLIIGFGETGQEALAYLYEFSAFIGENGERSPYRLTVVDAYMDEIKGDFYAQRPALVNNQNLQLRSAKVGSVEYWDIVKELVKDGLCYVVVSLGDDDLNIRTAIELCEFNMRYSSNNKKSVIYVKSSRISNEYITSLYEDRIKFFGSEESLFSFDTIINERHNINAIKFKERYNKYVNENSRTSHAITLKEIWADNRKLSQDLKNSYHVATKMYLLTGGKMNMELINHYKSLKRCPKIIDESFNGEYWYEDTLGVRREKESEVMTNLAKCEHLRWNASHEMLGYTTNTYTNMCDELSKRHNCLVSWQRLGELWEQSNKCKYDEYRQYDYNVVEVSILITLEDKRVSYDG